MDSRIVYFGAQSIFALLFVVMFFLNRNSYRGRGTSKLEALFVLFIITLILDGIWVFIDGVPKYRTAHIALETTYLSTMACTGYLWFLYTLDFLPADSLKLRNYRYLLGIPVVIEIILIFLSIKNGWIFIVDEGGTYIRGKYHIYTVLLNYLYMLLGSYVALKCRKEAVLSLDKRRFAAVAMFPIPVLLLSGLQMLLPPGLPAMQGGVLIGLLLQYGGSTDVIITRDYLTGLPNRLAFDNYLVDRMQKHHTDDKGRLYLMEGDIDNFKSINDTLGHAGGDRVLCRAADALRRFFSANGTVFRTGGDEFMIIAETDEELNVSETRIGLNEYLSEHAGQDQQMTVEMSLGISEYDGVMTFDEFIEATDRSLYADKRKAKNRKDNL